MLYILFALFLLLPIQSSAAVSISEVAWMGNSDSANYEWIELNNNGPATDISGWTLVDDKNFSIELEGVMPSDSYAVLERTSDLSAPGFAFLIYTGVLVNTGSTLRLLRADGSLVDQVAGGEDWKNIGGDNITKETAQYTTAGWITAIATPGNEQVWLEKDGDEVENDVETGSTGVVKSSLGGEPLILIEPGVTLILEIKASDIGYVNQLISFEVEPSGIGKSLINSLQYRWNFGDGFSSVSKNSSHVFKYPGTYVVTVYGGFKRQEQVVRKEITILPVSISLTVNKASDVQINNDSPYELNISGYRLKGGESFVFPPYSILLPNQIITIPRYKLGEVGKILVALYDTESVMVSSIVPNSLIDTYEMTELLAPQPIINSTSVFRQQPAFSFAKNEFNKKKSEEDSGDVNFASISSSNHIAATSSAKEDSSRWTYFALIVVISLGVLGVYATPRRDKGA